MTDVQQFYKALDIQPKMKCPTSPEPYTSKIIEDSDGGKRLQGVRLQSSMPSLCSPIRNH